MYMYVYYIMALGDVLYLNRYHNIVAVNADYAQSTFYD